jgi:hypothetical protein
VVDLPGRPPHGQELRQVPPQPLQRHAFRVTKGPGDFRAVFCVVNVAGKSAKQPVGGGELLVGAGLPAVVARGCDHDQP